MSDLYDKGEKLRRLNQRRWNYYGKLLPKKTIKTGSALDLLK